jgi:hypothetical protein
VGKTITSWGRWCGRLDDWGKILLSGIFVLQSCRRNVLEKPQGSADSALHYTTLPLIN